MNDYDYMTMQLLAEYEKETQRERVFINFFTELVNKADEHKIPVGYDYIIDMAKGAKQLAQAVKNEELKDALEDRSNEIQIDDEWGD